jgi:hypothetical protein
MNFGYVLVWSGVRIVWVYVLVQNVTYLAPLAIWFIQFNDISTISFSFYDYNSVICIL